MDLLKKIKNFFSISNDNSETTDIEELKDEIIEEFGPKNRLVETYMDLKEDNE